MRYFYPPPRMSDYLIDAHQDLAYSALTFGRDYLRPAHETRAAEAGSPTVERNGHSLLGWPEYQRGRVALIFASLYLSPPRHAEAWETQVPRTPSQARVLWHGQVEYYRRLAGDHPEMFRLVAGREGLKHHFADWERSLSGENQAAHPPTGLVLLMESVEEIGHPKDLEEWWEAGVRLVGPVWAGERFCGGVHNPRDGFTREGYELLEVMAGLGFGLDLAHMNERSALQALDRYDGPILATHVNVRSLLRREDDERHFTDLTIRRLVERGGVMGILPYSKYIRHNWSRFDPPTLTTLDHVIAHIDAVCQLAGDARHVGIGSDFDGGFGWPNVPVEIDTIADLQKLGPRLLERGYSREDVSAILGGNWRAFLERSLPA